jgi:hypothetical protein
MMNNTTDHKCTQRGPDVHCQCGGQLAVGGTIHPLADLAMGFRRGKFEIKTKYSRKVIGYSGFCLRKGCGKSGRFLLAT